MHAQQILTGRVLWCFDHELKQAGIADEFRVMLSFATPLYYHEGVIALTQTAISMEGDMNVHIPLNSIEQLYLGFDEHYKRMYVKNGGLFWQPLRVTYSNAVGSTTVYLIIDYNWFGAKNKIWYNALTGIFA